MVVAFFVCWLWLLILSRLLFIIMLGNHFGYLAIKDFVSDPFSSEMGKHIFASHPYMLTAYFLLKLRNFILVGMLARVVLFLWLLCPFYLSNTQGLCFVKAQYFLPVLYKSRILQPGFSLLLTVSMLLI